MAQWMHQFSGKSHSTKVAGLETSLRVAVAAQHRAQPGAEWEKKAAAVATLAARLLAARLRLYRARLSDMKPRGLANTGLIAREAEAQAGGVAAILAEFGALES
jgi:hypothetical protein